MSNYDTIRLEKGMYAGGNSLTHTLEELDPSENYRGTALEGLDAYQRQLKRFGIHVSGPGSDAVEKFFQTSDSAALFPEYVSRAVRQGLEEANAIKSLLGLVLLVVVLVVAWSMGDGTPMQIQGYSGTDNVPFWLKITDMFLYSIYILLFVTVVAIIVSGIKKKLS